MTDKRLVTFGKLPPKPEGTFKQIHFPEMARLDEGTGEFIDRILHSEGGGARDLPRTIYAQFAQGDGHSGAVAIGALHEFTLDEANGALRDGKGWLADIPEARKAALMVKTEALKHNSIDLSEVKGHIDIAFENDEPKIEMHFDEWKLGATTLVGKPAFANAHATMPDDEIAAALGDDDEPLIYQGPYVINFEMWPEDAEVMAGLGTLPPWDYFHRAEPARHHKFWVEDADANGWYPVYGHLGLWDTQHDGISTPTFIPRPRDNYASFNKPSVLTDKGMVEAGPICLYGGHFSLSKALDSVEAAWCDVRVVAGKHGPWMCGVVRPGVTEEQIYAARASRVSGHWKGGRLKAVVSVNAEGFDVPGSGFAFKTNARGEVTELVASYLFDDNIPEQFRKLEELPPPPMPLTVNQNIYTTDGTTTFTLPTAINHWTAWVVPEAPDFEFEKAKLLLELEDD